MDDKLKNMVDELQAEILEDARQTYTEQVVDRWLNPRNWGTIDQPDGFSRITGPCGDTMQIALRIEDNRILPARYVTDGCATSIASGSMATELSQAKTLEEAQGLSQDTILEALGGLPPENEHCALLASNVLRAAIEDYRKSKK